MAMSSLPPLHPQESGPLTPNTTTDTSSSSSATRRPSHPPQMNRDLEDDDDDPSLWINIEPTSESRNTRRSWRRGNSPKIIKLQIPSLLCDCVSFFWDWTFAAVEIWRDVLSSPPFPLETLQKVSIVLLGVERIRDNIDQSALIVFVNPDGTAGGWTLASVPHYLIWGIPGLIALLSISFVLTLQLSWGHQEEAVIATALILLIFLEALLPLFILGCTSMFLFQQVSWETGLLLLVIVWLGSTFCAHCIRRMLYQSLGHG